jgi:hypothetical protein
MTEKEFFIRELKQRSATTDYTLILSALEKSDLNANDCKEILMYGSKEGSTGHLLGEICKNDLGRLSKLMKDKRMTSENILHIVYDIHTLAFIAEKELELPGLIKENGVPSKKFTDMLLNERLFRCFGYVGGTIRNVVPILLDLKLSPDELTSFFAEWLKPKWKQKGKESLQSGLNIINQGQMIPFNELIVIKKLCLIAHNIHHRFDNRSNKVKRHERLCKSLAPGSQLEGLPQWEKLFNILKHHGDFHLNCSIDGGGHRKVRVLRTSVVDVRIVRLSPRDGTLKKGAIL